MSSSLTLTPARKPLAPLVAFVFLLFGAVFLQNSVGSRQVLLLMVGAALGLTLYHAPSVLLRPGGCFSMIAVAPACVRKW